MTQTYLCISSTDVKNPSVVDEAGGGGTGWEVGTGRDKLLRIGRINNKALLHSMGLHIPYPGRNHHGKEH